MKRTTIGISKTVKVSLNFADRNSVQLTVANTESKPAAARIICNCPRLMFGRLMIEYSIWNDVFSLSNYGRIFLYHRKKLLFPHFKPLVNVPKMYRLQVIYINQLREAVSDDHDTIFLILFFSTASDASHGPIKC